jgi:hypothetical protein
MFENKARVLDRLSHSTQLQAIHCAMPSKGQFTLLEKIANLQTLRGIALVCCTADWSALAKLPSLRVINMRESLLGLQDCSPVVNT